MLYIYGVNTYINHRPLESHEYPDREKHDRAFKLLSKQKSFYLRAKTVELRKEWFDDINTNSR